MTAADGRRSGETSWGFVRSRHSRMRWNLDRLGLRQLALDVDDPLT